MGDMKKLLENWRGYEEEVLNEWVPDPAMSPPRSTVTPPSVSPEAAEGIRKLSSQLGSINRMGVPRMEEFEGMDPEVLDAMLAEDGLTRKDLEEAFLLSDIIFDPEDPIDYVAAGMTAFPEPVTTAGGAVGLVGNRIRKLGLGIYKIPGAVKAWNAARKIRKSPEFRRLMDRRTQNYADDLLDTFGFSKTGPRADDLRRATQEAIEAGVGHSRMPKLDAAGKVTRPWLPTPVSAAAKGADDVVAAAAKGADDVVAAVDDVAAAAPGWGTRLAQKTPGYRAAYNPTKTAKVVGAIPRFAAARPLTVGIPAAVGSAYYTANRLFPANPEWQNSIDQWTGDTPVHPAFDQWTEDTPAPTQVVEPTQVVDPAPEKEEEEEAEQVNSTTRESPTQYLNRLEKGKSRPPTHKRRFEPKPSNEGVDLKALIHEELAEFFKKA